MIYAGGRAYRGVMSYKYIVILLLSAMAFLMISGALLMSPTYDEPCHLDYGTRILQFRSSRTEIFDDSKMPFSALNALTYISAKKIIPLAGKYFDWNMRTRMAEAAGRLTTIVFSLLLGVYIFKWSKEIYGISSGIFSLFLYAFSPNIIAHSQLITTDLYAALMVTLSVFYFWRFIKFGGQGRALLSASMLGLSQLAKYTCIALYPMFIAIVLIKYSGAIFKLIAGKDIGALLKYCKTFIKHSLLFALVSILLINAGFLFNKSFTPLSKFEFKSALFKEAQRVPLLKEIPVPVPYSYLQGLDWIKYHVDTGSGFGNLYLLGKIKESGGGHCEGFKGYYFYAFLFKEPLAIQLFIILSLITLAANRKKRAFLENELFLLLPALFYMVYCNFFFQAQTGIRYLLIIFPLLYVFCGVFFQNYQAFSFKSKSVVILLLIYLVASTLSYFPHYLSYFNEIAWDRKKAYKLLADSNIDWGQSGYYLKGYLEKNPKVIVDPELPVSGRIVVSVNNLTGVFRAWKYRWLRENFEPVGSIAYSYLIYDVSPEGLKKIQKETAKLPQGLIKL